MRISTCFDVLDEGEVEPFGVELSLGCGLIAFVELAELSLFELHGVAVLALEEVFRDWVELSGELGLRKTGGLAAYLFASGVLESLFLLERLDSDGGLFDEPVIDLESVFPARGYFSWCAICVEGVELLDKGQGFFDVSREEIEVEERVEGLVADVRVKLGFFAGFEQVLHGQDNVFQESVVGEGV